MPRKRKAWVKSIQAGEEIGRVVCGQGDVAEMAAFDQAGLPTCRQDTLPLRSGDFIADAFACELLRVEVERLK
jgi:hypothetical protein